jgi:DNA-binding response OmpR family regulator
MLVLSRDAAWIERLVGLTRRGGWTVEARVDLPTRREAPAERALIVLDRALAGASPARAVSVLRAEYEMAAVVLACAEDELGPASMAAALSSGADDMVSKSWTDGRLLERLSVLRDGALASEVRVSSDGALKVDRRARRAFVRARGRWTALELSAQDLELLWRLLGGEGQEIERAELVHALRSAFGREVEVETVSRRILALRRALKPWPGSLESVRGGRYRLESARRRSTT